MIPVSCFRSQYLVSFLKLDSFTHGFVSVASLREQQLSQFRESETTLRNSLSGRELTLTGFLYNTDRRPGVHTVRNPVYLLEPLGLNLDRLRLQTMWLNWCNIPGLVS